MLYSEDDLYMQLMRTIAVIYMAETFQWLRSWKVSLWKTLVENEYRFLLFRARELNLQGAFINSSLTLEKLNSGPSLP